MAKLRTYKYMGERDVNFFNSNGENIVGKSLYTAFEDEHVKGYCTDKLFLKKDITIPAGVKFGDELYIQFDHKGKVVSIEKA